MKWNAHGGGNDNKVIIISKNMLQSFGWGGV